MEHQRPPGDLLHGVPAHPASGPPDLAPRFLVLTREDLSPRLLTGAALFGIDGAIAGFCPGPAIVAAGR